MSLNLHLERDTSVKKPQKLFFILFGLLFLLAPFYYQANLGGEGLYIPHNSTIWLVAGWIIATACFVIARTRQLILPKYWFGLALLPLGALITGYIADNNNPIEWLVRFSVILGGYLFLIGLFQFRLKSRHIEHSFYLLLAAGMLHGGIGILQTYTNLAELQFFPLSPNGVLVGMFQQINLQVSMMATLLVLCFYLLSRPAFNGQSLLVKIALFAAIFIASFTIAGSGSRVGLLGGLGALALLLLGRWQLFIPKKGLLLLAIATVITAAAVNGSGLNSTLDKLDRAAGIGGMSTDVRWHVYNLSWQLFLDSPFVGHGLGSYQKVFQDQRAVYQETHPSAFGNAPRFTHPHNESIFWLVEGGMLAILGIVAAAWATLIQFFKLGWQRGMGYAALIFPIVLHSQVELPFYISNVHWFVLLFLLFVSHQYGRRTIDLTRLSLAAQKTIPAFGLVIITLSSFALTQAQVANGGIVSYLQRNQGQPQFLQAGLSSLYFREYTEYLLLRRSMLLDLRAGSTQGAQDYIAWAQKTLQVVPAPRVYRDLAIAYHGIGDRQKRDATMHEVLSIYPNDTSLQQINAGFAKDDAQQAASAASKAAQAAQEKTANE